MSNPARPDPSEAPLPAMHIGEVATRTELSLRSLRHWDEVGLLRPSGRSEGGFRLYTESDVDKIMLIRRMKPLGFSLDEMGAVLRDIETLANEPDAEEPRARLSALLADARRRRTALAQNLARADEFVGLLIEHGSPDSPR